MLKKDIEVLIADDHLLVRQGLVNLLNKQSGINVIGEAFDGLDAVEKTMSIKPDVLLLDINMPKMNGLEALGLVKEKAPNQKVIILTIHDSREYVQQSINKGADGYLSKDADIAILKDAIIRVFNGEDYIQPTMMKELMIKEKEIEYKVEDYELNYNDSDLRNTLTAREYQVIQEVANGKKNKEIATVLNISEKTVRNHMYNIFKKLDITDRTQAAMIVVKDTVKNSKEIK